MGEYGKGCTLNGPLCADQVSAGSWAGGINWADPALNIDWGVKNPLVSDKDRELKFLDELVAASSIF